jgi:type IV pilus assembly protein PilA
MHTYKRIKARGFTLVELMIVVAIIGVLAALAIYGVRKYLASAKSAEARNTIGAITRGAVAAYERENAPSELVTTGQSSTGSSHSLCGSSVAIPTALTSVKNKKYQPDPTKDKDYNTGNSQTGWRCLKFQMTEPQYYQYGYGKGARVLNNTAGPAVPASGWVTEAMGDLDGNGVNSEFALAGNIANGQPVVASQLADVSPEE